jgi:two-component system, sensor histidine kinase
MAVAPPVRDPDARLNRQIAEAKVDALFAVVPLAVGGAAIAAAILAATLGRLGFLNLRDGLAWVAYISICAAAHVGLARAYRRAHPIGEGWRGWALAFSAISLAEGLGWGWASVALAKGGGLEVELIVLVVALSVAAGAISAFSPYLPAFLALFVPTTFPYAFASIASNDPLKCATFLLMLAFICAMGALGVATNRSFDRLVRLRLRTEELAEDLQRQKEIAEQANLAKSTFLAAASHDLRQPVHALGLFLGALRGVDDPKERERLLDQIEASANAVDGLFASLLDISRLDAGVVEVHRRPFAIDPLLTRICDDQAAEAEAKGISLVRKKTTAIVDSDPLLVERILRNLASNAIRYTDRGRVVVGCRRRGGALAAQVWDSGRGIPADQQDKVFQEYYQLDNPERDRTKGLGLGLAIVRRLTNLLDCRLNLRSQPGRGSCFEVELPLAASQNYAPASGPQELSGALAKGLIVVVDDELAIREAMSTLLSRWGYQIVTASSGEEAVRRLSTWPVQPDLAICDYRLRHGESGIEVIERLRSEYNSAIPAMLITGDTAPDRLAEAKANGLLLLHKPVSNSRLRAVIANLTAAASATENAHESATSLVR